MSTTQQTLATFGPETDDAAELIDIPDAVAEWAANYADPENPCGKCGYDVPPSRLGSHLGDCPGWTWEGYDA
ncbi:hypothetical protein G9464_20725 [Halostella sp. JP-L12]|uniref:hypothetical protein n=1 Tax=Halostella TaxID=1843185 RepID=UPI000EF7B163|nr:MULTISPECIES: hypothetical protein [Halostella]NHN49997.1 hypothetical protein [Halostella sp. JP-L12]